MRKVYVEELSKESKEIFKLLANEQGINKEDIENGLDSKISDLKDMEQHLGFRVCENNECREIFNEGFLTEDCDTFCSSECAEKMITDIVEADYGEYIFYTDWHSEMSYEDYLYYFR